MYMRIFLKLLPVVLCLAIFVSCGGSDPVKFNDSLVGYINKTHEEEQKMENEIAYAAQTADFSNITENTQTVIDSINTYIKAVEQLDTPKDGEALKTNVIVYLKSVIVMVDSYKSLSSIDINSSDEKVTELFDVIVSKENKSKELFKKVEKEQKDFAKLNNIELV